MSIFLILESAVDIIASLSLKKCIPVIFLPYAFKPYLFFQSIVF